MFWVLLRREILAHLITFRFAITVITCLLLVATTMFIRINDYEQRLASYNAARDAHRDELLSTRTYSFLMPKIDRPPNPLSIFNAGMDSRLGRLPAFRQLRAMQFSHNFNFPLIESPL